jgi:predicted nucleotidyltransferase
MERKPTVATSYSPAAVRLVNAASLYIATKLGDFRDDVVIVGGLVPSLIVPQSQLPPGKSPHIGTMDVDLGLAVAILDQQRYHELCERLRNAGFEPDVNDEGKPTNQRWRIESETQNVTVDFLIPPTLESDTGGKLRNLEKGFAAIITPGLELAFDDKRLVTLAGETLHHEQAKREVWVCEAGAFIVLKALAFMGRGENKDAYDLVYMLQNYGNGINDVFQRLQPLLPNSRTQQALVVLENDFSGIDRVGTRRVAEFLGDPQDETVRADAAGAVRSLLELCRKKTAS